MSRFKLIDTRRPSIFTYYNTVQAVTYAAMLWVWATGHPHIIIDRNEDIAWAVQYNHGEIGMHLIEEIS